MTTPPADDGGLFDLLDVLRRGRQMCVFDADGPAPWLGAELPDGTWAPVGDANLHELERRGWVEFAGEQADGYLGVVSNSGQAADIAAQINAARRAEYQKVANSSGASLADVEAMAGKKAMERTPAGQYVQVGGKWVKK